MKYTPIDNKLYTQNRQRFIEEMKPNSIAIFPANPELMENGDAVVKYKANSDVVWLSGIVQEQTMVILFPHNPNEQEREVLVIQRPNPELEKWNGHLLRKEEATALSGIKSVHYIDSIDAQLAVWMHLADNVYLSSNENDRLGQGVMRTDLAYIKKIMEQYPLHHYERAAKIMLRLRAIKTQEEIAVVRKAVDITASAFDRIMQFIEPGIMEYELEAEIMHEFLSRRATRNAYGTILASGDRARILHYVENNGECKDGELILMDFGAEYGNYASDMSRTIPVNGKFTERQKQVYDACLRVHRYCASILKPGLRYDKYIDLVNEYMNTELIGLGLYTKAEAEAAPAEAPLYRQYFYHGIGHHMGLDVHDIGTRIFEVQEGMLFTIEPGIYIEQEQLGVRIENNFWITKDGNIDLFEGVPITTEEIEAVMAKHEGYGQ